EQSEGIAHVNQAVAHMDGATQHNASLVQQATQAAAALNDRAGDLQLAVGAFKLDDESADAVAANMPLCLAA
ncbi:MAG: methyl-accepting chemotaxis protein, partial [Proteobacteria bacterium]|nr:methyl-accepting chemotaxis protein [Pseudomonadota bacterium]